LLLTKGISFFSHYRRISTLQEYVLIDAEQMSIDRYRRVSTRPWNLQTYIAGESLDLISVNWESVNWEEFLELIYEDVQFVQGSSDSL